MSARGGGWPVSRGSLVLADGSQWSGDLEHDLLPEEVAVFFAVGGDGGQRYGVASNERASQHVLRKLLEDIEPGVWGSVLTNPGTSPETLEIASSLHPDSDDIIDNHLNASTERMRRLRANYVFGAQLEVFFRRAKATDVEQSLLHEQIHDADERVTLGTAWDAVRSSS